MLNIDEILGRSPGMAQRLGSSGCCHLGKNVSYPGGKYEEMGRTFLDIVSPHCMLVVGKRGTGKSYTLGVLAEGFAMLEDRHSKRVALVLVDTMSVFHSLKTKNTNLPEMERMKDFGIEPQEWPGKVRVLVPQVAVDMAGDAGHDMHYDEILTIPLRDVELHQWLTLFDLELTEPLGTLLSKVYSVLEEDGFFGFRELYRCIDGMEGDHERKEVLKALFGTIEDTKLFSKHGTKNPIAIGGKITILDISYLGRMGKYALRNLVVSIFARKQLAQRTLYTTIEMQSQAGLIESRTSRDITSEYPLIYMLIDEAHLFLPNGTETLATEPLIDWIKLGRHPGLSLILATQEPSALHDSAIRQSDIIIAHNLTARDDLAALGMAKQSYMNNGLDDMVGQMEFKRGLAIVFDDKTRRLQMCMIRPRHTLHTGIDASALEPHEQ